MGLPRRLVVGHGPVGTPWPVAVIESEGAVANAPPRPLRKHIIW